MLRIVGEVGRATAAVRAPRSLHTTRRRAQDLHRATLAALLVVAKSVNRISTSETDRRIERGAEVLPGSYSSCTACSPVRRRPFRHPVWGRRQTMTRRAVLVWRESSLAKREHEDARE